MKKCRMKRFMLAIVFISFTTIAEAQTFNEWFRQKKTQIRYLLEQIGQLQIQIELLKKGYKIVDNGLNTIHQIKDGEFKLHTLFFTSLKNINPNIAEYTDVADIIATQSAIIEGYSRCFNQVITSNQFNQKEIELFRRSFDNFKKEAAAVLQDLVIVTTSNKLEMTDDKRLNRIQQLKKDAEVQRIHLQNMGNDLEVNLRARMKETEEIELFKKLYGY